MSLGSILLTIYLTLFYLMLTVNFVYDECKVDPTCKGFYAKVIDIIKFDYGIYRLILFIPFIMLFLGYNIIMGILELFLVLNLIKIVLKEVL